MTPRTKAPSWLRTGALTLALAMACNAHAAKPASTATASTPPAAAKAPDVATDPAGAWSYFLAHAESDKAFSAYEALDAVGYDVTKVDADMCRKSATQLRDALVAAPVSVALHRAAMLCAEATGDNAAAEREMTALASLVRQAFASASDSVTGKPIRVLRSHDIRAVVETAGLEPLYARYPYWRVMRDFPLAVAAWDPERKVERHMRFDWLDSMQALFRAPEMRYPSTRSEVAEAVLESAREADIPEAVDAMAWKESRTAGGGAGRIAKLRMGANASGLQSARAWIIACSEKSAEAGCADGLVDTLLPLAEQKWGYATMLLAYAYDNGIGIARDEAAGKQLLDAADARWTKQGASVEYVRLWCEIHGPKDVPAALMQRLGRAEAAGSEDARRMRIELKLVGSPTTLLDAKDVAFLSQPSQNGQGSGYALLAAAAVERKDSAEQARWRKLAAEAGAPQAQFELGYQLAYADGGPKDKAAGRPWLVEAANGANTTAARVLAWDATKAGDYAAAEKWLIDPGTRSYDVESLLAIARMWEFGRTGASGTPERAIAIYRDLASSDVAEARRRLALMAAAGRNMPKDGKQARAWLEVDANKGDHESEAMLGLGLLSGQFGPEDEREGTRWVERAIAGGSKQVSASYGMLLFRKGTPASRAKAVDVWRAGVRNKDDGAANNYAWALCTTDVPGFVDGKTGLATANEMGPVDDLPWGYQDTVAACRAAAGDFTGAVELQKRVLEGWRRDLAGMAPNADNDKQTQKLEKRLALYQAGKPYIEAAGDQG